MIAYLEGKLLKKETDRILLLANQVGYEVLMPAFVMQTLNNKQNGDAVALYIYYQQTERQPKPVLIGFNLDAEREFFEKFISVADIGPLKAVKALSIPIRDVAIAIETKDVSRLEGLKGIGPRTAQKIVATLYGKMEKFALIRKSETTGDLPGADFIRQVKEVLVRQLGHNAKDAQAMITRAIQSNPAIHTAEELFDEVYRKEAQTW